MSQLRRELLDSTEDYPVPYSIAGCCKPPWQQRKEAYIQHLADVSPETLLVSCCDKLHNSRSIVSDLRSIGDDLWTRFKGGKDGTLWYYRTLVKAFRQHNAPVSVVDELDRVVSLMEELAQED